MRSVGTLALASALSAALAAAPVRISNGSVEGSKSNNGKVQVYKGIPYAAPPVGDLRWKAPQPPANWDGVRDATSFGARCMQGNIFGDMVFRDNGPSEDCLYLNVWAPNANVGSKLPVMVWIYGGGFAAGAASEPRQDGEHLAEKGVVAVSFNYRLGVFGFFSHPDLTKESGHNSSGNYGLLDQVAALEWVKKNIASFGGDPGNVTIFGESAGSFSVSALMASPLTDGLFARAIGESGAFFSRQTLEANGLTASEKADAKFAQLVGASSLKDLRAKPATELLEAALKQKDVRFRPNIDGYFLPEPVPVIFAAGKQRHVPLLAGWNADEGSYRSVFGKDEPTPENFSKYLHAKFGDKADAMLKLYPAADAEQAKRSAQDLAGDEFIGYSTWKWIEMQNATGKSPVYRYRFEDAPPVAEGDSDQDAASRGAYHSAEIEFVFGALASKHLPWRPTDYKLSNLMSTYWTNFAKTGDPNSAGLPQWPPYAKESGYQVMHLKPAALATPDAQRSRYELLDRLAR